MNRTDISLGIHAVADCRCPSCDREGLRQFYHVPSVPVHSCLLMETRQEALTHPQAELRLAFCPACGFIFYQNPAPAAGAVIVEDRRILLVRRSVNPGKGDWCIPAGFVEWTEHPQQTARREIREETGLEISITSIFDIFMGMDDPRTHAVLVLYHADKIGGMLVPGDDADEARYFDFDNLPDNIAFQAHRDALDLYRNRYLDA